MSFEYLPPEPSNQKKEVVFGIAEAFAQEVGFLPGDRIEPVIPRLGGQLEYLGEFDSIEATDGSLYVDGPKDFRILVSAFTGAERDRFTIAHELGHFVLHSNRGAKRIRAARFGSDRVEWEANWFAAAFLMPEDDFRETCQRAKNNITLVSARYLVSAKAAEIRMRALGII